MISYEMRVSVNFEEVEEITEEHKKTLREKLLNHLSDEKRSLWTLHIEFATKYFFSFTAYGI